MDAQTYTGIVVLEDLIYDPDTGIESLPQSAFMPEFYKRTLGGLVQG